MAEHDNEGFQLDAFEIRVLAVLAEKEALTPDSYPLSVNALTNGCNQLSSRDPVMSISEDTVLDILHGLTEKKLVAAVTQAGARVTKYEHRMRIKWTLEQDKLAVLTTLMLRGLQTAGEIRARTGRLYDFASVAQVESALQFLVDKYPPLVARLPVAPGAKEPRYGHLLSGEDVLLRQELASSLSETVVPQAGGRVAQLEQELAQLRREHEALVAEFAQFRRQFD